MSSTTKGVHFAKREQRWVAKIYRDGRSHHIGTYVTEDEAVAARVHAEKVLDVMQPRETAAERRAERERQKVLDQIDAEFKDKTRLPDFLMQK